MFHTVCSLNASQILHQALNKETINSIPNGTVHCPLKRFQGQYCIHAHFALSTSFRNI